MTPRTRHNIKNGFYLALFIGSVAGFTFWFMTLAAQATGPNGEWHTWEVQGDYGPGWDQNYAEAFAQPQKHVGEGQLAPECGTWYQQDFYPYAAQKHGKSIAEVIEDGLLHDGEDHHLTGHKDGEWRFVYGGDCATPDPTPTTDKWDLSIEATCEAVTFSHPQFKQSTHPEYRVDVDGVQGERVPYTWGETVTIPAPDTEVDTVWEVRIFAKNPSLNNAYQQLGSKKAWSQDCVPVVTPEPEPEVTHGEAVAAVGECVGSEFVTTTTVTPWTEVDGERTYGEPTTTTESSYDPTCDPDTPACGPLGSCGTVPEKAEDALEPTPEPTFAASSTGPIFATDDTPTDSTPVLAATGADTSTPLMIAGALALVGAGVAIVRRAVK